MSPGGRNHAGSLYTSSDTLAVRVASAAGRGAQPVILQQYGFECPLPLSGPQLPSLEDERHGGDIFASL